MFCKVMMIMLLLNQPIHYASLKLTYEGEKVLTHFVKEDQEIPLVKEGSHYYAYFLTRGNYEVYSEEEYVTSFSINRNHLQKGIQFTFIEKPSKEMKKSIPVALIVYLFASLSFFLFLGWIWLKMIPSNTLGWYNDHGEER